MPTPPRPDKFSLRLGALGLGQAGGNLAAELARRGYRALAINTAQTDLRSLSSGEATLSEEHRLYVGLEGTDGAGKDPEYGCACLEQHASRIVDEVRTRFEGVDVLLLCAGLGGGTGSALPDLYRLLKPTGLPVATLVTLPAPSESGIVKVNAVRAVEALVDSQVNARFFVDNERVAQLHPDLDVLAYYREANASILDPLDDLNRLNGRNELRSLRSFDGEDLRKVLLSGGVIVPSVSRLDERVLTSSDLERHVLAAIDGGHVFAKGMAADKTSLLAVVLVAPENVLRELRAADVDDMEKRLKQRTGGGALYTGLYASKPGTDTTLMVLASSTGLPKSVEALLGAARKEGQTLAAKIHEELPRLDASSLASMNLSRAPAPAAVSRPPPPRAPSQPPAPRPVQAQVMPPGARPPPPRDEPFLEPLVTDPLQGDPVVTNPGITLDKKDIKPRPVVSDDADGATIEPPDGHLHSFYDDMVERFRAAPDRKARERVARRLIEDSRSEKEEVRSLSVWAMVSLCERGFRRALYHASRDASADVRKLALEGLERLEALEKSGVDE